MDYRLYYLLSIVWSHIFNDQDAHLAVLAGVEQHLECCPQNSALATVLTLSHVTSQYSEQNLKSAGQNLHSTEQHLACATVQLLPVTR